MKTLVAATLLVIAPVFSQAASLTCQQIQEAAKADAIEHKAFNSDKESNLVMQIALLRRAVVLSHSLTPKEAKNARAETLLKDFDPIFENVVIAGKELQSVNLSLGDNPYVYLFDLDTKKFSGVMSADGSIEIDGKYCETDSDIL